MYDNNPLQSLNLASISGVIAATLFIVEILKRIFKNNLTFGKIPVFVYASLIAVGLAFLANNIHTDDGSVLLAGSRAKVLWAALIAALGSSGFYTWLRNPEGPNTAGKLLILMLPLMLIGGCSADKVTLREGLARSSETMWKDHVDWAEKLTADPTTGKDHRDQLPTLQPSTLDAIKLAHEEFEGILADDRKRGN